ncbi:MAG TPA: VapC toxin family PIN domain ribonuclease [Allosphingosinicella sp.]|nr:VapC toxin family PIN domain ribonuclease [Allosphingosinicella sp.]
MILVDTSIWADHFGRRNRDLDVLLGREEVLGHAYVTAEVALGNLVDPAGTIKMLSSIPQAKVATQVELMKLIRLRNLAGSGVGFVDAHLLASCRLSETRLWTRDKRLRTQANALELSWEPHLRV